MSVEASGASSALGSASVPSTINASRAPAAVMEEKTSVHDISAREVEEKKAKAQQEQQERLKSLAHDMTAAKQSRWRRPQNLACDSAKVAKSMPGPPQVETLRIAWANNETWSASPTAQLADRLLKALDSMDAIKYCGSFLSFQDYTWCSKAMPKEFVSDASILYKGSYCNMSGQPHLTAADVEAVRRQNSGEVSGISYGTPGGQDPWSEVMSNLYLMPTTLVDCKEKHLVSAETHDPNSEQPCSTTNCYSVTYTNTRSCLGDEDTVKDNVTFETLKNGLRDRAALSTHVKMDLEDGAEWKVLEQLVADDSDMAKIRTLDFRAHMTESQVPLEKRVQIFEELVKNFAVVGSTVQKLFHDEHWDYVQGRGADPKYRREPEGDFTSSGMPFNDFAVSMVNRRFL